jgi:GTP-binding protein
MGKNRTGANGRTIVLQACRSAPRCSTKTEETLIADFTEVGQRVVLLKGGDGGFGNAHFKTSTNQAPRRADLGMAGHRDVDLAALKLIADAGLVGLPNAGKSTFLAAVSSRQAEDRRLSLHHAAPEPRRRAPSARSANSCWPTCPG